MRREESFDNRSPFRGSQESRKSSVCQLAQITTPIMSIQMDITVSEFSLDSHYAVVILGAGLAGLSLARQLLLHSHKRVLLLEKSVRVPVARQKVGEATVQVSGYYF